MISKRQRKALWILVPAIILVVTFVGLPSWYAHAFCDSAVARAGASSVADRGIFATLKTFVQPHSALATDCPLKAGPTKPTAEKQWVLDNGCSLDDSGNVTLGKGQILRLTNNCESEETVVYDRPDSNSTYGFPVRAGDHKDWQCPVKGKFNFTMAGVAFSVTCKW